MPCNIIFTLHKIKSRWKNVSFHPRQEVATPISLPMYLPYFIYILYNIVIKNNTLLFYLYSVYIIKVKYNSIIANIYTCMTSKNTRF